MEKTFNTMPGYRVNEYLLVLYPHEDLCNRILKVKQEFAATYKTQNTGRGRPYLPLVTFTQYALLEERIINCLCVVSMGFPPFKVELKDFGSFPSHTIYLNVTSKLPVQKLVKEIRTNCQRLMKPDEEHKPHFIMEPHITIAQKLKPWQYEKGWLEYSHRHFTGRFIADGMSLLKRPAGEKKFQLAGKFLFQNMPVITKQGDLFT